MEQAREGIIFNESSAALQECKVKLLTSIVFLVTYKKSALSISMYNVGSGLKCDMIFALQNNVTNDDSKVESRQLGNIYWPEKPRKFSRNGKLRNRNVMVRFKCKHRVFAHKSHLIGERLFGIRTVPSK